MIEKFEFCSAEIIVNWCSPIRLLNMQKMVEKWLEIPYFCCHFYIFQNVAAKRLSSGWYQREHLGRFKAETWPRCLYFLLFCPIFGTARSKLTVKVTEVSFPDLGWLQSEPISEWSWPRCDSSHRITHDRVQKNETRHSREAPHTNHIINTLKLITGCKDTDIP